MTVRGRGRGLRCDTFELRAQYLHELHSSTDQSYLAEQEMRRAQFLAPLENIQY